MKYQVRIVKFFNDGEIHTVNYNLGENAVKAESLYEREIAIAAKVVDYIQATEIIVEFYNGDELAPIRGASLMPKNGLPNTLPEQA